MEIHDRIQALRKELDMSRRVFGENLGVSGDVINNIENNRLKKPEQKEPIYKLICEKFNVNYFWLTEGKGDMFISAPESMIEELAIEYDLDELDQKIIEKYLKLDPKQRDLVKKYFKNIFE